MTDTWLRRQRRQQGWTVAEFAGLIRGSIGNTSETERGMHVPTITTLKAIAAVLGKSISFVEDKIRQDYHGKEKR